MNNLLLILLSPKFDRDQVIKSLEEDQKIDTWFYSFPNTIFVKSNLNCKEMSFYIREKFGVHIHFITQVENDYFGRMNEDQWKNFKRVKY
jgi:hypothetical protein